MNAVRAKLLSQIIPINTFQCIEVDISKLNYPFITTVVEPTIMLSLLPVPTYVMLSLQINNTTFTATVIITCSPRHLSDPLSKSPTLHLCQLLHAVHHCLLVPHYIYCCFDCVCYIFTRSCCLTLLSFSCIYLSTLCL